MDMFCPQCSIVLPPTAQRCNVCGNTATLAPGSVVNHGGDTYTIASVLGIGGMGIVYKATDYFGSDVVVKQVYVDNPADLPEAQRRFRREALIQSGLNHPAFPRGFGYFADQGFEFMAMEFVPGQDLEKTLAVSWAGHMDDDETLQLGIQMCDGLTILHNFTDPSGAPAPIIHRDIKPANIILRPNGQICILDLGIARAVVQSAATVVRATRAGTLEYCSPQQVSGTDMSIRDDIYSIAATLFHLRTGGAFIGNFNQRAAEIDQMPPNWRAAFRRAINNDTNLRQRSADDFKQELLNLLPPHLRPGAVAAPAPPPAPAPVAAAAIRWRVQASYMSNPNEWVGPIGGQVIAGRVGVPGANIIPIMTDVGPGAMAHNTRGTVVNSSAHGDFGLSMPDVTVPVTVDRREIEVIVEDPNTGQELYRETVEIDRPGIAQRARAKGAARVGAVAHGAAAPFRMAGHGVAAGARGLGHGLAWPFQAGGQAIGRARAAMAGWLTHATTANLFAVLTVALVAAMLVGIATHQTWLWTLTPWLAFMSGRAANLARRGKLPGSWKWAVFPRLSTIYIGIWLIIMFYSSQTP